MNPWVTFAEWILKSSLANSVSRFLLSLELSVDVWISDWANFMRTECRSPCLIVPSHSVCLCLLFATGTCLPNRCPRCQGDVLSEVLPSRRSYSGFQASCHNVLLFKRDTAEYVRYFITFQIFYSCELGRSLSVTNKECIEEPRNGNNWFLSGYVCNQCSVKSQSFHLSNDHSRPQTRQCSH
jgi:hypothetical protein